MTEFDRSFFKRVFFSTLIVVGTTAGLYVAYVSSMIILSTLIGIGMASLISPVVTQVEKKYNIPRFVTTLSILAALSIVFTLLFIVMGSIVLEQYDSLKESFPKVITAWEGRWESLVDHYPRLAKAFEKSPPLGLAKTTVGFVGNLMAAIAAFSTGLTLAIVIALFTTTNSTKYFEGFVSFFPTKMRNKVEEKVLLSGKILRKWFLAQLIDMVAVCMLTTVGLWISGIQYWALYGLMAGLLSIVPYFGIIAIVLLSGAIVAVQQPDLLIYLVGVFVVTQQIEGNFILPKVMKDHVHIPAAPLFFFMIIAGSWLGALGIFVTPPLLAISVALYSKP